MGVAELVLLIILVSVAGKQVTRVVAAGKDRGGTNPQWTRRLSDLEAEVMRLRDVEMRIEEIEERMDFAERMLTRQGAEALPPQTPGRREGR